MKNGKDLLRGLEAFEEGARAQSILKVSQGILDSSKAILREAGYEGFAKLLGLVEFEWEVLPFTFGIANKTEKRIQLSWAFFRTNYHKIHFRNAIYHLIAHIITGEEHNEVWKYFVLLIGGSGWELMGCPLPLDVTPSVDLICMNDPKLMESERLKNLETLRANLAGEDDE